LVLGLFTRSDKKQQNFAQKSRDTVRHTYRKVWF
jgi:hypothetical protein